MGQVTSLIGRLKAGSRSAFHCLFAIYYPRQVGKVRRHLSDRYAGLAAAEDVAQSVLWALWRAVACDPGFRNRLTDSRSLHAELWLLRRRKISRVVRYDTQDCRDIHKTFREADHSPVEGESPALDLRPAPAAASFGDVELEDLVASLLARLTERQQVVVLLRREGWTNAEIARQVGHCERTIERELETIRDRCGTHPDLAPLLQSPQSLFGELPE